MNRVILRAMPLLAAIGIVSGCVTRRADYNPAYVPAAASAATAAGRAMLLVEPPDSDYVYSGRPDSFHAGGTTLVLPLGRISTEIAKQTFGGVFGGGCVASPRIERGAGHAAIIKVRPLSFWYGFNQLRNLTMAITPQVRLSLEVSLMDESRSAYFQQVYDSGVVNDRTVLDTLRPGETVSRLTHRIVADLLSKAAVDVARTVAARGAVPVPAATANAPAPVSVPVPTAPAGTAADRLKKLKELFDQGLISKGAYEADRKSVV